MFRYLFIDEYGFFFSPMCVPDDESSVFHGDYLIYDGSN